MQFNTDGKTLLNAVQRVSKSADKKATLLDTVLIQASSASLQVSCGNTETDQLSNINTTVAETGAAVANVADLVTVLKECRGPVTFASDGGDQLAVASDGVTFELNTQPPQLDKPGGDGNYTRLAGNNPLEKGFHIPAAELSRAVATVGHAMSVQDVRYYLNGMLWRCSHGRVEFVATDGHRLSRTSAPVPSYIGPTVDIIVPQPMIKLLQPLLKKPAAGDVVRVEFNDTLIRLHAAGEVITAKRIDGRFPDYDRAIPKVDFSYNGPDGYQKTVINRAEALPKVKKLAKRNIRFHANGSLAAQFQLNRDDGGAGPTGKIDIKTQNPFTDEIEIGVNGDYFVDAFAAIDADEVELWLSGSNNSMLLRGVGSDDSHVVSPMRL